jgi:hypothetical protein
MNSFFKKLFSEWWGLINNEAGIITLATGVAIASVATSVFGTIQAGNARNEGAKKDAAALEAQGIAFENQANRQAESIERRAGLVIERADREVEEIFEQSASINRVANRDASIEVLKGDISLSRSQRSALSQQRQGTVVINQAKRTATELTKQGNFILSTAFFEKESAQLRDKFKRELVKKQIGSAISRAAKSGVVVATGSPLEQFGEIARLAEFELRLDKRDADQQFKGRIESFRKNRVNALEVISRGLETKREANITADDILLTGLENKRLANINSDSILISASIELASKKRQVKEVMTQAKETATELFLDAKEERIVGREGKETGLFNARSAASSGRAELTAAGIQATSTILTGISSFLDSTDTSPSLKEGQV